ncbi:hypothetical protein V6N13_129979 [Hibiscus sabdariffa]
MLFWKCCKETTKSEFANSKCDTVDNNFFEAFNSAIIGARFKYIISMLEDIRHYVMNRIVENKKKKSLRWKGELCHRIEKKLEEHKKLSSSCHVIWNGAEGYEVVHGDDTFVVDVREWTCTCRVWDLIGIPCPHAVCVILYREEPLNQYVIGLYKKQKYQELYSVVLPTVASEQFWKDSGMGKIDPPLHRKMPGRPKHKRIREEGEVRGRTKLRKLGSKLSCRLCGGIGHDVITCPKKTVNVENHGPSPTPSAPPSSQTSHVPPSSQIPSPPSSQISSPPSSQTSHVPPSSQIPSAPQSTPTMPGRPSQVLLSRPHTRSFTKPTSQPTSTTATSPLVAPVLASSGPDATATVSPEAKLPKLTIKRHPPKN